MDLENLKGSTIAKIVNKDNEHLTFVMTDGRQYVMFHCQDCCEDVRLADTVGSLDDIIGSPILEAEIATSSRGPMSDYHESYTWTYYKIGTIKGHVSLRWYGHSNGYYSESVQFEQIGV